MKRLSALAAALWIIGALASSSLIAAEPLPYSQIRAPDEDYQVAADRFWIWGAHGSPERGPSIQSAWSMAVPLDRLDASHAVSWDALGSAALGEGFREARDTRFLRDPQWSGFRRRVSWLYPDDGCFARATMSGRLLGAQAYPRPSKLFVFGNLTVRTRNALGGSVSWWFHVTSLVRIGGQAYVLDPALFPERPLSIGEWARLMSGRPGSLKFSICAPGAYTPDDACLSPSSAAEQAAASDQSRFLVAERARLTQLGRDPQEELGDSPPW